MTHSTAEAEGVALVKMVKTLWLILLVIMALILHLSCSTVHPPESSNGHGTVEPTVSVYVKQELTRPLYLLVGEFDEAERRAMVRQ